MAIFNPPLLEGFDTNETNTQAPSQPQIDDGYSTNEIPLSENHGFMFNQFYKWLNFLKETGVSQWDNTISYQKDSRAMRDGRIYKSSQDANQGNDPLSTSLWSIDQWMFQTTTHDTISNADYTLTAEQNGFGRIVITDTNPFLSIPRNINVDNSEKSFIFQNDTLKDLTVKTVSGTGVLVVAGTYINLYNDGVNVITADAKSLQIVTAASLGTGAGTTNFTNTSDEPVNIVAYGTGSSSSTFITLTIDGVIQAKAGFGSGADGATVAGMIMPGKVAAINMSVAFSSGSYTVLS